MTIFPKGQKRSNGFFGYIISIKKAVWHHTALKNHQVKDLFLPVKIDLFIR